MKFWKCQCEEPFKALTEQNIQVTVRCKELEASISSLRELYMMQKIQIDILHEKLDLLNVRQQRVTKKVKRLNESDRLKKQVTNAKRNARKGDLL